MYTLVCGLVILWWLPGCLYCVQCITAPHCSTSWKSLPICSLSLSLSPLHQIRQLFCECDGRW